MKVDFVSADAASRWDVYADDVVICTTPCERYVSAEHPVMLRARDDSFGGAPDRVRVVNLLDHASEGRLQLQAHHTARGELATGITFTALSGIGMVTGIALTGTGYGADHTTMAQGGRHHDGCLRAGARGQHLADPRFAGARRSRPLRQRVADVDGAARPAAPRLGPELRRRHVLSAGAVGRAARYVAC